MLREILPCVQEAFATGYGEIQNVGFDEWPELTAFDADGIMQELAANLWRYRRPADRRFIAWAKAWVRRETRRYRFLTEEFDRHFYLLLAAIKRGLYKTPEDWAVEPKDYLADLRLHLLQNPRKIDGILNPKKGKSTSVLFGLARSRMRAVRDKLSDRRASVVYWKADLLDSPGIPIAEQEPEIEDEKNLQTA
jgi:hypothetical protein